MWIRSSAMDWQSLHMRSWQEWCSEAEFHGDWSTFWTFHNSHNSPQLWSRIVLDTEFHGDLRDVGIVVWYVVLVPSSRSCGARAPLQQTTCALESCKNGFQSRSSGSAWVGAPRRTLGVPTEFHAESKVLTPLGAPFAFPRNSFNPICSCHSPRIPDQLILHFGTKHMPGICHTSTCYLNTLDIII